MFKGFYTVATGMIAQQRRTELLTNNLSNVNTPGFKTDQSTIRSFPDMLLSEIGGARIPTQEGLNLHYARPIGTLNTGVYMQETIPNHEQGQVFETNMPTDIALMDTTMPVNQQTGQAGTILFRLQNAGAGQGETYTRNGNFTLDGHGYLVNPQGLYVLSEQGQRIQLQSDDFQISQDGFVYENNQQISRIGISYSANPDLLIKQGDGLFRTNNNQALPSAYTQNGVAFTMQQSYLERSNVDSGRAMTDLMTAYRAFEANQKILQAYDRSMEKAVNEIGKV